MGGCIRPLFFSESCNKKVFFSHYIYRKLFQGGFFMKAKFSAFVLLIFIAVFLCSCNDIPEEPEIPSAPEEIL